MKSLVSLVSCPSYDQDLVDTAVRRAVDLLGGVSLFVSRSDRIVLKPNILAPDPPERGVTTHPAVFTAAARICQDAGARVLWGDSPAVGSASLMGRRPGLTAAARAAGVETADFNQAATVSFPEAMLTRQLDLSRGALEADGIVSLPKMKTHGFMKITGAVKNTFGCVPGLRKPEYHLKMPAPEHFAGMLVDISRRLRPRLHVMDGILAMEGNGPRGGTPRWMKLVLASGDPVALDAVFCRLIRLDPEWVPTMKPGQQSGLGTYLDDEIEIVGDDIEILACPEFKVERAPLPSGRDRRPAFLKNLFIPRPVIDYHLCTNCGSCVEICPLPKKAVDWQGGDRESAMPGYDHGRCIRCYCCQEICPHRAISIRTPILGRMLHRTRILIPPDPPW